jgi:hypothetical protein
LFKIWFDVEVVERGYSYGATSITPYELRYEQPFHWWLLARLYHHYDMIVFRLPGFKALERWCERRTNERADYMPISARQDLRCYNLRMRGRTNERQISE